jgi:hypothetical protein
MRDVSDKLCELGWYLEASHVGKRNELFENGQKQVGVHTALVGLINLENWY